MKRKAVPIEKTPSKKRITDAFKVQKLSEQSNDHSTPTSTVSEQLCGRENEYENLTGFFSKCVDTGKAGCLYVSGPPGTGKTAMINQVVRDLKDRRGFHTICVNCYALGDAKSIYERIIQGLSEHTQAAGANLTGLKKVAQTLQDDCLTTRANEVLYSLFELPRLRGSRLTVVGIANALDLTDRVLPRLKAKLIHPELVYFKPYSALQIASIVQHRLDSLPRDVTDTRIVFHPAALQLCAKKVSAQTGDVRKAFDICRRAIDIIEEEIIKEEMKEETLLGEIHTNIATPTRRSKQKPILGGIKERNITIAHIARASSLAFGGSTASRLKNLNIHQKAALCAISVMEKSRLTSTSGVTVDKLFKTYNELCRRDDLLGPVSWNEFQDIIAALDVIGLINLSKTGTTKSVKQQDRHIGSNVSKMDLLVAVGEIGILNRFLVDA